MQFYGTSFMQPYKQPGRWQDVLNQRKAAISFLMSVRLSAWNDSPPTGPTSLKFDIGGFFLKSVEKIQVSLKSDKNFGYFTRVRQ
jgi:hypothetical protein